MRSAYSPVIYESKDCSVALLGFADANFHRTDLEATKAWFLSHWLMLPAYAA